MATGITEEKLNELADDLANHDNLEKLGLALGFKRGKVKMYLDINRRSGNSSGTSDMLFAWKSKTPKAVQVSNLKKALTDADLVDFADDYLTEEGTNPVQGQNENPSASGSNVGSTSSSSKRRVTNEEITKLSKLLPERNYSELFQALGFDYNYAQNVMAPYQLNITAATKDLLQQWKAKTGGYVDDLDAAMIKAEVGGLIPDYKQ